MNGIDIDLNAFAATRAELDRLAARQRAVDADIAAAKRALESALRAGASADERQSLDARVTEAQAARGALVEQRRALNRRFDALADGVLVGRDPSALVASLHGDLPIALLPMRLETRYVTPPDQSTRLRIRIYPDDINTIDHEPTPTADELSAGMAYWRARFAHADDDAARLLRDLAATTGRGRASWLVRTLTPTNPLPAPDVAADPEFPPLETIAAQAKMTRAVLLPERFCAIGYAAQRREVFRVWGGTVPDELVLSPDWLATDDPEALLGGDRAWMVDFDAALAKGMAIEVTQGQIAANAGFNLATGTLERLVVVGF